MSVSVQRGRALGEVIVRDGDHVERMFAVTAAGVTWVFHDGDVFRLEEDSPSRRRGLQTHGSLSSPMPATVIAVKVAPGDAVTSGQTLIVLEAMKMELPVRAPGDGRVTRVHCKPGDLVQPDVSLIDFE
jgi:acetyl-CoA/propionyl-CoA carboxylase biotin carboxyl carrier protein